MSTTTAPKFVIIFKRAGDGEYDATDGTHTVRVIKAWERAGGWQWTVPAVKAGTWHVKQPTRHAAAEYALRLIRNRTKEQETTTMTTTDTDRTASQIAYQAHRADHDRYVAAGNIENFVVWNRDNPSPLRKGLFGEELTERQALNAALSNAAVAFKGTRVAIEATDTPDQASRMIWTLYGTIMGTGHIQAEGNGARDTATITLEEGGRYDMVRISRIVGIRNAD